MEAREQRGLVIAALCRLNRKNDVWLVPSQSSSERQYEVDPIKGTCTCLDHQDAGFKCKHLYAVEFTLKREVGTDGTVTETKTLTFTEKKTYKQDWPKYDEAQMTEKHRFLQLLHDLCKGIPNFPQPKTGRRHIPLSDIVFSAAYKVYSTVSARRFTCDLKDAHDKGYTTATMHPLRICFYLENPLLTPVLQGLIVKSSLPLRSVETTFAPDSTGFSTSRFVRWFDEKYGVTRSGHDWVKAHAICGVKTNIVTAVEILERNASDCPQFKTLVEKTAENFTVKEVPADKGYLSKENFAVVERLGGTAYIPFKSNNVAGESGTLWEKMYLYYNFKREEFAGHYHQRSNAESTFSMIKAKFRDHVRSKTDVAMKNEVLCKFLCHNICVLIQSHLELGIEPVFWTDEPKSQQVIEAEPFAVRAIDETPIVHEVEPLRYLACVGA
jgi:transposase